MGIRGTNFSRVERSMASGMSRIRMAMIFQNGMILQRNKRINLWGEADGCRRIHIKLNQAVENAVVENGTWRVSLPEMEAASGLTLEITADDDEKLILTDIAIGEVWIAGGQSNMEFMLMYDQERDQTISQANYADIRYYECPKISYEGQLEDEDYSEQGFWRKADIHNAGWFSAVGYYFAQKVYEEMGNIPIGIISCNWGGSSAAAWMTEDYLEGPLQCYLDDRDEIQKGMDREAEFIKFKKQRADEKEMKKSGLMPDLGVPVLEPFKLELSPEMLEAFRRSKLSPFSPFRPCGLFHTMLSKVIPYTIRGAIWYQGEEDTGRAELYDQLFGSMICCWREKWQEEFPFLFVQLAPLGEFALSRGVEFIPIRAMQDKVSGEIPGTYMASIMDIGMRYDIHPKRKRPVGERLAALALGKVYDRKILCEAPEIAAVNKEIGYIRIKFRHCGEGLLVKGDTVNALEVYIDHVPAQDYSVSIDVDSMTIDCGRIVPESSVEIRLEWVDYCEANLYNSGMLPAKPFKVEL